jgi:hypothetical protein
MQRSHRATETVLPSAGSRLPQPVAVGNFVINLCSSTTPVALAQVNHAELKKFTFFVSRRREDRRERFRLHMGYFSTQEDAEKLLELVREIYPAAWAGVAPGQRLRATAGPSPGLPPLAPAELELPLVVKADTEPTLAPAPVQAGETAQPVLRTPAPTGAKAATNHPKAARLGKQATAESMHSVRAAIASLEESSDSLSSSQVLKVLEPSDRVGAVVPEAPPQAAGYAVQLRFSVQPIPMSEVPQLAIFDAYTLYNAEGNRDGRRWYGLRLGFFSDSASAKQVANYVRSEFSEVAVVPVSERERGRATRKVEAAKQEQRAHNRISDLVESTGMFKLAEKPPSDADGEVGGLTLADDPGRSTSETAGGATHDQPSPQSGKRKPPMSLEETLEVLGASQLKLDNTRKELLSATTARLIHHASHRKQPSRSKLARLFDRLADKFGNL